MTLILYVIVNSKILLLRKFAKIIYEIDPIDRKNAYWQKQAHVAEKVQRKGILEKHFLKHSTYRWMLLV